MARKNVELINDTNYSITDRNLPVKKKRRIFGTVVAIVISLLLALFMRYYVEISGDADILNSDGTSSDETVQLKADKSI